MKLAIIGSRGIEDANIGENLPDGVEEIVSGGAAGKPTRVILVNAHASR